MINWRPAGSFSGFCGSCSLSLVLQYFPTPFCSASHRSELCWLDLVSGLAWALAPFLGWGLISFLSSRAVEVDEWALSLPPPNKCSPVCLRFTHVLSSSCPSCGLFVCWAHALKAMWSFLGSHQCFHRIERRCYIAAGWQIPLELGVSLTLHF